MPSPEEKVRRVVVTDDQAIFRAGLRLLLQSQPHINVAGEADTSTRGAAAGLVARERPDIILFYTDTHAKSSLGLPPNLLCAGRGALAIVLTDLPDPETHRRAVPLGAAGVVVKDEAEKVLVKAISKVGEGEVWLDRRTAAGGFLDLSRRLRGGARDEKAFKIDTLTTRKRQTHPPGLRGDGEPVDRPGAGARPSARRQCATTSPLSSLSWTWRTCGS